MDVAPDNVEYKGRLSPGNIFLVDFAEGRVIADQEVRSAVLHSFHPAQGIEGCCCVCVNCITCSLVLTAAATASGWHVHTVKLQAARL